MNNDFISIASNELAAVTGGASEMTFEAWVAQQRKKVAPPYKKVVCRAAGAKGGAIFAIEAYGANRTTGADMVRGGETVRDVCLGGTRLPEGAPQSPF